MTDRQANARLPGELDALKAGQEPGDHRWLKIVRDAHEVSTDYLEAGILRSWESSLERFHSRHPKGSKYHSKLYANRSKIFRPKTRAFSRRTEAMAAKALFSNSDLIDVRGQNVGSETQAASARLNKELLQYRLEHTIPWFLTVMGARQDCYNNGICVSLSTWEYRESETTELMPLLDEMGNPILDEEGNELGEEVSATVVERDRPIIKLIPPENLRINPSASWIDPVGDSPTVTIMLPMYAGDVLQKMTQPNPVTQTPEWREYTLEQVLTVQAEMDENQGVRRAREGNNRQDALDSNQYNDFTTVWTHLNIVRDEGVDYGFYTLGTQLMLTDPVPVKQLLPLGRESITIGISVVESHRVYPDGGNALAAPLQYEINDVANQRMDNVKLALNKRFILRRNANVDQAALMRSTPGGGIMAGDPDKDIRVLEYNDVTGSSYQEQDRLASELDDLAGMFSGSSVQANRSLNETVGGMSMLQGDALTVSEYELRTFIESWVEPVLRKLQKLEAMFETDEVIMAVAAENAELFQRYGEDVQIDQLIDHELIVSVNVGMGNTDPMQRLQRFMGTLQAAANIPEVAGRMKGTEVGKEVFSLGGFSSTERFFMSDEEFAQKQQAEMEAQQGQQNNGMATVEAARVRAEAQLQIEQMKAELRKYEIDLNSEDDMGKHAANLNIQLKQLYEKIDIDREKVKTQRDVTALREGNHAREMRLKREMGSGI